MCDTVFNFHDRIIPHAHNPGFSTKYWWCWADDIQCHWCVYISFVMYHCITPVESIGGADRSCLPAISSDMQPPVIPAITSNLTGTVETCQPWGLTISGGVKPYQIVLSALQSITITNSSMGIDDDVYTYIDRADPGELLMGKQPYR